MGVYLFLFSWRAVKIPIRVYLQGTDFLDMKENERVEQIYTF